MQYIVTNRIHAKIIYQIIRIDYIALGLAHLIIVHEQPWMTEYLLWQRLAHCHQENRPINCMETDNILSDQMQVSGPELLILLGAVAVSIITDTGDIVGQCIHPYINNMLLIKGHRNAPCIRGTGYTQILQTRQQEVIHHLVLTRYRLNKFRMCINVLDQLICIFAHTEEICLFLCRGNISATVRTFAVYQLSFRPERLARSTVHTFISSFVNISLIVEALKYLLYLLLMIIISGTNELVIRNIQHIAEILNGTCHLVNKLLGSNAGVLCFQLDLLTMLIGSGLEEYIIAFLSLESGNTVCQNYFVVITYMRFAGSIGNCSCKIILFFVLHLFSPFCYKKFKAVHE